MPLPTSKLGTVQLLEPAAIASLQSSQFLLRAESESHEQLTMALNKLFLLAVVILFVSVFCQPLRAAESERIKNDITESENIIPPLRRGASYGHPSHMNDGIVPH